MDAAMTHLCPSKVHDQVHDQVHLFSFTYRFSCFKKIGLFLISMNRWAGRSGSTFSDTWEMKCVTMEEDSAPRRLSLPPGSNSGGWVQAMPCHLLAV